MTNEERIQAIEWLKRRPVMMAGAKRMYDLAVEALEAYVPGMIVGKAETSCESNTEITRCSDDTISRQAAIDTLNEQIEQCNKALGSFDISLKDEFAIKVERASLEAYKEQLENLPTVQPTIIRCRDCKYSIDEYNDGNCYCKRPSRELVWIGTSWDFFCKAGDKREGE